jgi:hypothetical protein
VDVWRGARPVKLRGEFILRQIMGDVIAVPVGDSALDFNGMICLNEVGEEIWKGLQAQKTAEEILISIVESFDVSRKEAEEDLDGFLSGLRQNGLLED